MCLFPGGSSRCSQCCPPCQLSSWHLGQFSPRPTLIDEGVRCGSAGAGAGKTFGAGAVAGAGAGEVLVAGAGVHVGDGACGGAGVGTGVTFLLQLAGTPGFPVGTSRVFIRAASGSSDPARKATLSGSIPESL